MDAGVHHYDGHQHGAGTTAYAAHNSGAAAVYYDAGNHNYEHYDHAGAHAYGDAYHGYGAYDQGYGAGHAAAYTHEYGDTRGDGAIDRVEHAGPPVAEVEGEAADASGDTDAAASPPAGGESPVKSALAAMAQLRALLKQGRQPPKPHPRLRGPAQPRQRRPQEALVQRKLKRDKARREAEEAKRAADEEATRKRAEKAALRAKAATKVVTRKTSVEAARPTLPASRPGMQRVVYADHGWLATVAEGVELRVKRRIEAGQDIHVRDERGWNALLIATVYGRAPIVTLLVANGAHINSRDREGNTALMWACRYSLIQIVRFLIAAKAKVNRRNKRGQTALMLAAESKDDKAVHAVLIVAMRKVLHMQDEDGMSALHYACLNGATDACRRLVNNGALVNLRTKAGYTPVMLAARRGHSDVVAILLDSGADPNIARADGSTALHEAVTAPGDTSTVIGQLIDAGADPQAATSDDMNPMMMAVFHARLDSIKALVEHEASVGAIPGSGEKVKFTPLTMAAHYDHLDVLRLLMDLGAVEWMADGNGDTALQVAMRRGHSAMVEFIDPTGAEREQMRADALSDGTTDDATSMSSARTSSRVAIQPAGAMAFTVGPPGATASGPSL